MLNAATAELHTPGQGKKRSKPLSRRVSFRSSAVSAVGVTGGDARDYAEEMERVDRDVIPVSTDARANPLIEIKTEEVAQGQGLGAQGQGLGKETGQGLAIAKVQGLTPTPTIETTPSNPLTATKKESTAADEGARQLGVGSNTHHPHLHPHLHPYPYGDSYPTYPYW